ncbi:MAG TPA: hypothetical protein ENJ18_04590 [Nannocystis exedens]|nr:hypothetical protein [Nannocystis exedens]
MSLRTSLNFFGLLVLLSVPACSGAGETTATATTATTATTSTGTTATSSVSAGESTGESTGEGEQVEGVQLLRELGGLWSGSAAQTPLGTIPLMNMDLRASDPRTLFGRVDLDAENGLRFGFAVETHDGVDVLVFRNGGYFWGIPRDSRSALVSYDAEARSWHFCDVSGGCEYVDARFDFSEDDRLVLDVKVKGEQHLYWDATRVETRSLPEPFPVDEMPVGKGDQDFPEMPTLKVDVQWEAGLGVVGEVWVILTSGPCDLQMLCPHSRSLRVQAAVGSTDASVLFEQIHAGSYRLNAVLDRNGNMAETGYPDAGDGLSVPNASITVADTGESSALATIVVDL